MTERPERVRVELSVPPETPAQRRDRERLLREMAAERDRLMVDDWADHEDS